MNDMWQSRNELNDEKQARSKNSLTKSKSKKNQFVLIRSSFEIGSEFKGIGIRKNSVRFNHKIIHYRKYLLELQNTQKLI